MRVNAYLLAADPAWLEPSVLSYYALAKRIVVSYDKDGLSWTGQRLPVDECLGRLRAIDTARKMDFRPGAFARPTRDLLDNDTHQRQEALNHASEGADWVLQIDTDEVVANPDTLVRALQRADACGRGGLDFPARWLYGRIPNWPGNFYLEGCSRLLGVAATYGLAAVRAGTRLRVSRNADVSLWRVDYRHRNTDPWRPRDAIVDAVIGRREGMWHFSWVRTDEDLAAKGRSSAHVEDFDWEQALRLRGKQLRHPIRTAVLTPMSRQRTIFDHRWLRPVWVPPFNGADSCTRG